MEVEDIIRINLICDRPLFSPPEQVKFKKQQLQEGQASGDNELLYEQFEINIPKLKENIRQLLRYQPQVSLQELIKVHPIEKGVAEVVAYLDIATKNGERHSVSTSEQEEIQICNSQTGQIFKVKIPKIIFS